MPKSFFRLLSYNIHQGITARKRNLTLSRLRDTLKHVGADLVLLQEVAGRHSDSPVEVAQFSHQLEALADATWPHQAYARNAVFSEHFHGNAILSRYPIVAWHNQDISFHGREKRGLLHAVLRIPLLLTDVHVMTVHLGLSDKERAAQLKLIESYVKKAVPADVPLFIGGDFNDWRKKIPDSLTQTLGMNEVFSLWGSSYAKTYPSRLPLFALDRIYFRGGFLHMASRPSGRPWNHLSDHLPLIADFSLPLVLSRFPEESAYTPAALL